MNNNAEEVFHPCIIDGLVRRFNNNLLHSSSCIEKPILFFDTNFIGKYDLEACVILINSIIDNSEICEKNELCNLSALKNRIFSTGIKEVHV